MSDIKLSTAIREGAKLRPQCFGPMYEYIDGRVCSCAMGAAAEALHLINPDELELDGMCRYATPYEPLDALHDMSESDDLLTCPVADCGQHWSYTDMVPHLNDDNHKWTREAIADWLASIGY